jgi:subtilisin family serine protease
VRARRRREQRKRPRAGLLALVLLAGAFRASAGEVDPGAAAAVRKGGRARVVVVFREDLPGTKGVAAKARSLARLSPEEFEPLGDWPELSAAAGFLSASGLEKLAKDPDVLRVDLDLPGRGNLAESVPLIRADAVHRLGLTGRGATVAILDSGVTANHPDLADDVAGQQCFCVNLDGSGCCPNGQRAQTGPGSAADDHGHGTNVAGIVTSGGRIAPVGVAPDAKVVAVKVLDRNLSFSGTAQVISGLEWVRTNRPDVRIVNMSLGTFALFPSPCDGASAPAMALAQAVAALRARGVTVFVSSGNDRSASQMEAPACVSTAVSVGATYDANFGPFSFFGCSEATAPDKVACFGNSAPGLKLFAPGAAITSAGTQGISTFFGTSQAAPHAAGTAALLLQARPSMTPDQIEETLVRTGKPILDPRNGLTIPRVDAEAALASVGAGASGFCVPDVSALCLNAGRFRVQVAWRVEGTASGGVGSAVSLTADTGYFWFFSDNNVELVVKVVDGRPLNGRYWFFAGALTDVEYAITVTDTATGNVRSYFSPGGVLASLADTSAFAP